MGIKSYKIKHDYLFIDEDIIECVPPLNDSIKDYTTIPLSKIMEANDEIKFNKILNSITKNVVIVDDIGKCMNPNSDMFKQFIIRCVYRKLRNLEYNVFI